MAVCGRGMRVSKLPGLQGRGKEAKWCLSVWVMEGRKLSLCMSLTPVGIATSWQQAGYMAAHPLRDMV